MKKEIKFRAQRTDSEQFVEGYYVKILASQLGITNILLANARICHIIFDEDGIFWHIKPETLGQYADLKDKNGKEIYGGDILSTFNSQVIFDNGAFYSVSENYSHKMLLSRTLEYPPCEVVGNIYENPELLKSIKE